MNLRHSVHLICLIFMVIFVKEIFSHDHFHEEEDLHPPSFKYSREANVKFQKQQHSHHGHSHDHDHDDHSHGHGHSHHEHSHEAQEEVSQKPKVQKQSE